jgi:Kdo2-lipid IVA lauroyltransferase/acyltransferase
MRRTLEHIISLPLVALLMLLSILPLRALLVLSRGVAFLLDRVFGYRKAVVLENLRRAFPELDEQQIRTVSRQFYLHFSDIFLETIKVLSVSGKTIRRYYSVSARGKALLQSYYESKQSVVCLFGHYGNWEWSGLPFRNELQILPVPVYKPLKNKVFDWLMRRIRCRFAHELIPLKNVLRTLLRLFREGRPVGVGLIADQSPDPGQAFWMPFLNQDTAVNSGPEKLARQLKLPVIYYSIRKERRGYYTMDFEEISARPQDLPEEELTRKFMALLERDIRSTPPWYLWSHKRWKHQRSESPVETPVYSGDAVRETRNMFPRAN